MNRHRLTLYASLLFGSVVLVVNIWLTLNCGCTPL
jgi:hypothetical protein